MEQLFVVRARPMHSLYLLYSLRKGADRVAARDRVIINVMRADQRHTQQPSAQRPQGELVAEIDLYMLQHKSMIIKCNSLPSFRGFRSSGK